jgi:adenine-specific DNA methylase
MSAWTIATETGATGLKNGKVVQGTVNLIVRKRVGGKRGDLSDIFPEIQEEVRRQIEEMKNLDDLTDPNFGDADLQLAAYAAALRVLTGYAEISEIDVAQELRRTRARGEESQLAKLIRQAIRIASDFLVPQGIEPATWRKLSPEERLYLKGIETEATGEAREGVYQELARGYGTGSYRELYATRAANQVRFKTATEFDSRDLRRVGEEGFAGSTLRQLLFAVASVAAHAEHDPRPARVSLRAALPNYWTDRERLADLLVWLADRATPLPHWRPDAEAARLLAASLRNDSV